jgi:hypothetical protein
MSLYDHEFIPCLSLIEGPSSVQVKWLSDMFEKVTRVMASGAKVSIKLKVMALGVTERRCLVLALNSSSHR